MEGRRNRHRVSHRIGTVPLAIKIDTQTTVKLITTFIRHRDRNISSIQRHNDTPAAKQIDRHTRKHTTSY